jgi:hypothetical protein
MPSYDPKADVEEIGRQLYLLIVLGKRKSHLEAAWLPS